MACLLRALICVRRCLLAGDENPFLENLPAIPSLPIPIIERRFGSGFCARACFGGRFSPRDRAATTIRLSVQRRRRWAGALSLIKYGIRYITREQLELGHVRSSASTTDSQGGVMEARGALCPLYAARSASERPLVDLRAASACPGQKKSTPRKNPAFLGFVRFKKPRFRSPCFNLSSRFRDSPSREICIS